MKLKITPKLIVTVIVLLLAVGILYYFLTLPGKKQEEGLASGNGRIEATEVDIAAKLGGRIDRILVNEGDYVKEGDLLAVMQTTTLEAELAEAQAALQKALTDEKSAVAQVAQAQSDKQVSLAMVKERESALDAAQRRYKRSSTLVGKGAVPVEEFDTDETNLNSAKASLASAKAQVSVSQSAIDAASANVNSRSADIRAAEAKIARINADIDDCSLVAPRPGRVQYRIAQPGEVVAAGGKLLNLVDMTDVYMTFYLPTEAAGQVALGGEARILLDSFPDQPIPATISFVSSVAQFTPKTVETKVEREKLMFRVKAQIAPEYLEERAAYVKTGLPGVAWVKLDAQKDWPASLALKEAK